MSSIGNTIYEDAASVGRFRTLIGFIIASVIGLILFIFGVYRMMYGKKYEEVSAVITKVGSCQTSTTTSTNSQHATTTSSSTTCLLDVKYTFNKIEYTATALTMTQDMNNLFAVGHSVSIYIDPTSPEVAHASPEISGSVFIIIGLIVVGIGYLSYWLSNRYKFFAAAEGAGLAADVLRGNW